MLKRLPPKNQTPDQWEGIDVRDIHIVLRHSILEVTEGESKGTRLERIYDMVRQVFLGGGVRGSGIVVVGKGGVRGSGIVVVGGKVAFEEAASLRHFCCCRKGGVEERYL